MNSGKKVRKSLSVTDKQWEFAVQMGKGNGSKFISEILDEMMAGSTPTLSDSEPLLNLCRQFAPARVSTIENWLKIFTRTNQAQIVATMIDGLAMEADDQMERLQVDEEQSTYGDNTSIIRAIEDTRGIIYPARRPDR